MSLQDLYAEVKEANILKACIVGQWANTLSEEDKKEKAVKEEEYFAGLWQQLSNTRTHSDIKKAIIQELKDAGRWNEHLED